ncbi:MAG: ABC transporter ATP-binding protein [Clostridia bacterium]|nr:ABC transporter ATP-binding protein [Clostridia bacterium]
MIEVKGLIKQYGNHRAVDNLNFTIGENLVFGFLGPNGAGKSTTMNMITGCLSPTDGEVLINGHSMFDEPDEAKKYIGYLPEIPPVYEDMTPFEYLKFVGEAKKIPKLQMKEKIESVMEETSIEEMRNRLIKNLSKGYRQRVGIAQAILGEPPIIILDEPTVGLDPGQIIEIRELIKKLRKKHTVILSSHILSEISAVCDHIMIISNGKLVAMDTAENLVGSNDKEKHLAIEIKGDREKAFSVLSDIDGLYDIKNQDSGNAVFSAKFVSENDPREQIFYRCSENFLPIISMNIKKSSLEEIFLSLVAGDTVNKENEKDSNDTADSDKKDGEN